MEYFSLFLDGACLTAQSALHLFFLCRLTEKRQTPWYFASYLFLLCLCAWFTSKAPFPQVFAITGQLLLLSFLSRFCLGNRWTVSWGAALLAVYITQLSFGIINSLEALFFPHLVGTMLLYPLLLLATLGAFLLCACCYRAILLSLSLAQDRQTPYIGLLVFPCLFFLTAELYILHTAYSTLPPSLEKVETHGALLFLQALGLGALLCTVYAYRQICQSFQDQATLASLTQAAQAQKRYVAEAQLRYNTTRAFRHDINNHLSVLKGFLERGNTDAAKDYLDKLKTTAAELSLPCQTGNPVVDILLGEKLALAESNGIKTDVSLRFPQPSALDDFDLCVIFANAMDNAIQACLSLSSGASIHIQGKPQGDFYFLTFENTCTPGPLPPRGQGLRNVHAVAEKYHGAMTVEKRGQAFSLSVLLNISIQRTHRSEQSPCIPPKSS